jgi:hypothetical protein
MVSPILLVRKGVKGAELGFAVLGIMSRAPINRDGFSKKPVF